MCAVDIAKEDTKEVQNTRSPIVLADVDELKIMPAAEFWSRRKGTSLTSDLT